ncbi:hypothetical protein V5E97_27990 [Singulisphaera sp. Ch08]|uniref:Uncharacterized protein n=1 Tax=Singulisphaera sp. Ch08 TaxID=3120278 RepID=A0AAU7CB11_9BACT
MRGRFIRLVPMVGIAFTVCTPVFVFAQVRKEVVEPAKREVVQRKAAVLQPARVQLADPVVIIANGMDPGWTRQFRPILQVEYLFLRMVCNPSKEERLPIARAGFKSLDAAAKSYLEWQNNQNMIVAGRLVERPANPDPRKMIQNALVDSAKTHLSSSQFERYRAELDARSAEQKRVAILNLVAKLDHSLVLSPEQRDQISESLSSHWEEAWAQGFQSFSLDNQYFPMVPDPLVAKHLNANQKTIWSGLQKVTFNSNGLGSFMNAQAQNLPLDDEFSDEVAQEDPKPATKK